VRAPPRLASANRGSAPSGPAERLLGPGQGPRERRIGPPRRMRPRGRPPEEVETAALTDPSPGQPSGSMDWDHRRPLGHQGPARPPGYPPSSPVIRCRRGRGPTAAGSGRYRVELARRGASWGGRRARAHVSRRHRQTARSIAFGPPRVLRGRRNAGGRRGPRSPRGADGDRCRGDACTAGHSLPLESAHDLPCRPERNMPGDNACFPLGLAAVDRPEAPSRRRGPPGWFRLCHDVVKSGSLRDGSSSRWRPAVLAQHHALRPSTPTNQALRVGRIEDGSSALGPDGAAVAGTHHSVKPGADRNPADLRPGGTAVPP